MPHITSHSVIFTFEVCVSVFSTFQITILLIPHISSNNHAMVRTPFGFIGKKILGHTYSICKLSWKWSTSSLCDTKDCFILVDGIMELAKDKKDQTSVNLKKILLLAL